MYLCILLLYVDGCSYNYTKVVNIHLGWVRVCHYYLMCVCVCVRVFMCLHEWVSVHMDVIV